MIKAALNFLAIGVCVLHLPIASQAVTITPAPAPATEPCTTAYDLASQRSEFSRLVSAVDAAGLKGELDDPEAALTLLAPTNGAVLRTLSALNISEDQFLANPGAIETFVRYHIIEEDRIDSVSLEDGMEIETAAEGQEPLLARVKGDNITFVGAEKEAPSAQVVQADIPSCEALIHIVDAAVAPDLEV